MFAETHYYTQTYIDIQSIIVPPQEFGHTYFINYSVNTAIREFVLYNFGIIIRPYLVFAIIDRLNSTNIYYNLKYMSLHYFCAKVHNQH